MNTEHATENAELYRAGRHYLETRARLSPGAGGRVPRRAVATGCGADSADVEVAAEFAGAVDRIALNCGVGARELLLSGHPRLPAKVVVQISRTHPERQRFALEQVRAGRSPLGKPPEGVEPPFDTLSYGEVTSRLARNAGLLDHVADGLLATPPRDWPCDEHVAGVLADAELVLADCGSMASVARAAGGEFGEGGGAELRRPGTPREPFDPSTAGRKAASVRGVAGKNARDLPRLVRESPPAKSEADAVLAGVARLRRSAERLAVVAGARGRAPGAGPRAGPAPKSCPSARTRE